VFFFFFFTKSNFILHKHYQDKKIDTRV